MRIIESGAAYSAIVGISEKLQKLQAETGKEYLFLNRGVNAVCPIDLTDVIPHIDFNSAVCATGMLSTPFWSRASIIDFMVIVFMSRAG